jgi:excisionase family DNA binding protein
MTAETPSQNAPSVEPLALRPTEAAKALGVSPRVPWAWTAAGEVPHLRRGRVILYPVAALREWLAAQAEEGKP